MRKKSKINKLRKKISRLKKKLKEKTESTNPVSPLAPAQGFPDLPIISGVSFATVKAGVKYSGRQDVMLASLCEGAVVAGVFTKSETRAAPVIDCQNKLANGSSGAAAILVNSGNANAFTGKGGAAAVENISSAVALALKISKNRVFTSSTGVIGEALPWEKIVDKVADLANGLKEDEIRSAAKAIMTTDTFPKGASASFDISGQSINISGIAKGSGMIAPDMATMLVYIFTDAKIEQAVLQNILNDLVKSTFNSITVDSDTSTSDTVLIAATGKSAAKEIGSQSSLEAFSSALESVMKDLAQQIVRDGEGATKFIEINVSGARSNTDAHRVGMAIANSPLVKTAVAGEDPNWGRVVMAVGKSGAKADRDLLAISFGEILVAEKGMVSSHYNEEAAARYMKNSDLAISVDLGIGAGSATIWTCDLTHGYISINADYRS